MVRSGSAAISNDAEARTWTIGANGAALTLLVDPARDFQIARLVSPSGEPRTVGALPGTQITVGGKAVAFGNRAAGFVLQNVATSVSGYTVRLDITYESGQPSTGGFMEPVRGAVGSLGPLFGNLLAVLIVLGALAVPALLAWLGARTVWRRWGWQWPDKVEPAV